MKLVGTQLAYFFQDRQARRNVRALLKYVAFVVVVVVVFAEVFHLIMVHVEGEDHSWVTGLYWTLTVMSTLGFGDITFQSDLGRVFSIVVLISGIVLLLIVLPFAFIRFFYAPWLEAQIRTRAPRRVPAGTTGHVILCAYDTIAPDLIARLEQEAIPYFVLLSDAAAAAELHLEGVSVVAGDADSTATWEALGVDRARLVFANRSDVVNTNIALTVREIAPDVPIVAVAGKEDSVDVLELSGATHVLPLKTWLGEQLASRVDALYAQSHAIGRYQNLLIAELPVHHTPLVGKTIRETRLRAIAGVSIIGVWERGRLRPARPDIVLTKASVPVLIGTEEQFETLDDLLLIYGTNPNPVLVIGGGTVGRAATRALQRREVPVHLVEQSEALCERLGGLCEGVFAGDAADYDLLKRAGIMDAPSVLLTTNDDAVNIYLASYCRHLNPDLRIVSRITHARNSESIHRAGADFVLSYDALGASAVHSVLHGRELVVLGEGIDLFSAPLPRSLWGRTLAETGIGARTGLNVIAVQRNGDLVTSPPASMPLEAGVELVMLGDAQQRREFIEHFGA
ncbi:MAG: NAD-binding protein [Rhodothermales bacterium]